jgi:hypothetical protein
MRIATPAIGLSYQGDVLLRALSRPGKFRLNMAQMGNKAREFYMAHDVFISYSHVDKAAADACCATLERAGIRCWIAPRDITPGAEWSAAIVNAIDQCRVIVVIFSSNANNSRQIRREVERAITAGVTVLPVRIENVVPTESLAYFMSTVHWLDALTPPLENHLQRLADSIKALLQVGSPGAPGAAQTAPAAAFVAPSMHTAPSAAAPAAPERDKPHPRTMFREIMNFNYRRNWLQAIGFFVMYFVIGVAIGAVVGRVAGIAATSFSEGYDIGNLAGQLSAIPYHLLLAVLLIWNRPKEPLNILLALAGVLLSSMLGALGGLPPLAILSTRPVSKT